MLRFKPIFIFAAATWVYAVAIASGAWLHLELEEGDGYTNTVGLDLMQAVMERELSEAGSGVLPRHLGGSGGQPLIVPFQVSGPGYTNVLTVIGGVTSSVVVYTNYTTVYRTNEGAFTEFEMFSLTNVPYFTTWREASSGRTNGMLHYLDDAMWRLTENQDYVSPRHYTDLRWSNSAPDTVLAPASYTNFDAWFSTPIVIDTVSNWPQDFPRIEHPAEIMNLAQIGFTTNTLTNSFMTITGGAAHLTKQPAVRQSWPIMYAVAISNAGAACATWQTTQGFSIYDEITYGPFPSIIYRPAVTSGAINVTLTVNASEFKNEPPSGISHSQKFQDATSDYSLNFTANTLEAAAGSTNLWRRYDDDDHTGISSISSTVTNAGDLIMVIYTNVGAFWMPDPTQGDYAYENTPYQLLAETAIERYVFLDHLYLTTPDTAAVHWPSSDYRQHGYGERRWSGWGWADAALNPEWYTNAPIGAGVIMDYVDDDPDVDASFSFTNSSAYGWSGSPGHRLLPIQSNAGDDIWVTNFTRLGWEYLTTIDGSGTFILSNKTAAAADYDFYIVHGGKSNSIGSGTVAAFSKTTISWNTTEGTNKVFAGWNQPSFTVTDAPGFTSDWLQFVVYSREAYGDVNYVGAWLDVRRTSNPLFVGGIATNRESLRSWYMRVSPQVPLLNRTNWPTLTRLSANGYGTTSTVEAPYPQLDRTNYYQWVESYTGWMNPTSILDGHLSDTNIPFYGDYANQKGWRLRDALLLLDWKASTNGFDKIRRE